MMMGSASLAPLVVSLITALLLPPPARSLAVPVWFDSSNGGHVSIDYHPEQPARIDACVKALREVDGVELIDTNPRPPAGNHAATTHAPFSEQELEHAREILSKTHDPEMVENLEGCCTKSRQLRVDEGRDPLGFIGYVDDDTYLTTESFGVCLRATASWIRAVDHALAKGGAAFALTRPPGHHATPTLSNGFCLLNFAAAAVVHALEVNPGIKVSVFDWDVHYGQGVAKILKEHDRARYVSIHQTPAFPYMGTQPGVTGTFENIKAVPIPAETTWTCGYEQKLDDEVLPFLCSPDDDESWKPDLVLVCAGYDALDSDELASVNLQAVDYYRMATKIVAHLEQHNHNAHNKKPSIALGLEGGYQLSEFAGGGNLADAVAKTLEGLV